MLEVDKKHIHEVRRQVEAMALRIFCAKINSTPNLALNTDRILLNDSIEHAINLRKKIDEVIKERVVSASNGDISKQLDGSN